MAEYAQINPGKYHLGYRFPTPVIIEKLPANAEKEHRIELKYKHSVIVNRALYVVLLSLPLPDRKREIF